MDRLHVFISANPQSIKHCSRGPWITGTHLRSFVAINIVSRLKTHDPFQSWSSHGRRSIFLKKKFSMCSVFTSPWKNHGPSFEQTLLQTSLWLKLPKASSEGCQYFATYFPFLFPWNDTLQFEFILSKNALSQVWS